MIKTKNALLISLFLSVTTGCSSISKINNSIGESFSFAQESASDIIDLTLDKKISFNQIIEKSLYDKVHNMGGVLQLRGANEHYNLQINYVNVDFKDKDLGPMTTTFSGIVFIDGADDQMKTDIRFVTKSLIGTKQNYVSGHKFEIEDISLDRFHMVMRHDYEQAFESSLNNVVSVQLNGIKLVNLDNTSKENRDFVESSSFQDNKHQPKIQYDN
jgi:hypothetical protein